jgi:hypothetical protein
VAGGAQGGHVGGRDVLHLVDEQGDPDPEVPGHRGGLGEQLVQVHLEVAGVGPAALEGGVDAERDRDRGPLGQLGVALGEGLEHAEEVLHPVRGAVPGREFAHRHVQRARHRPPDRLVRPGLDLAGAPQPLEGHRPERVQQHGLADAAQPGEHHAPLRTAPRDPLQHHLELADLPVAPGELGRTLPRAGGIGIAHRVHGIGLYGLI